MLQPQSWPQSARSWGGRWHPRPALGACRRQREVRALPADHPGAPAHLWRQLQPEVAQQLGPAASAPPSWPGDWPRTVADPHLKGMKVMPALAPQPALLVLSDTYVSTGTSSHRSGLRSLLTLVPVGHRVLDGKQKEWGRRCPRMGILPSPGALCAILQQQQTKAAAAAAAAITALKHPAAVHGEATASLMVPECCQAQYIQGCIKFAGTLPLPLDTKGFGAKPRHSLSQRQHSAAPTCPLWAHHRQHAHGLLCRSHQVGQVLEVVQLQLPGAEPGLASSPRPSSSCSNSCTPGTCGDVEQRPAVVCPVGESPPQTACRSAEDAVLADVGVLGSSPWYSLRGDVLVVLPCGSCAPSSP